MSIGKAPPSYDLEASRVWVQAAFGVHELSALRQVHRCLGAVASYEHSFCLSKAGLLSNLERWPELADWISVLLQRYPGDPEVLIETADFLKAHGSWLAALGVARKAKRSLRAGKFPFLALPPSLLEESILMTEVECLYALGRRHLARRTAVQALRRHPRMRILRSMNLQVQHGTLKIEPWAPKRAPYLERIRKMAA
jgi:hypothetical protein